MNDKVSPLDSWFTKPYRLALLFDLFVLIAWSVTFPLQTTIRILTNSIDIAKLCVSIFTILEYMILVCFIRFVQIVQLRNGMHVSREIAFKTNFWYWVLFIVAVIFFLLIESDRKSTVIIEISSGIYTILDPLCALLFFILLFGTQFDFSNHRYMEILSVILLLQIPHSITIGYNSIVSISNSNQNINNIFSSAAIVNTIYHNISDILFITSAAFLYLAFNKQVLKIIIVMTAYPIIDFVLFCFLRNDTHIQTIESICYLAMTIIMQTLIFFTMRKQKLRAMNGISKQEQKIIN